MYESNLKLCVCGHIEHLKKCNQLLCYKTKDSDSIIKCSCKKFDCAIDLSLKNFRVKDFGLNV